MRKNWHLIAVASALMCASLAHAQQPTLPEKVVEAQQDVHITVNADGPRATVQRALDRTDLIVRAVIGGPPTGHLTADERSIYTRYALENPQIVYSAKPLADQPLAIRVSGGTVKIGEFSASMTFDDNPRLQPGMNVVLLLAESESAGLFGIAGPAGGYEVRGSTIVPLFDRPGEHHEWAGWNVNEFLAYVVKSKRP